jgi:hypothetical protein
MIPIERHRRAAPAVTLFAAMALTIPLLPRPARASAPPDRLRDRGPGVSSSLPGTYIERGQFLVYPFFAYSLDHDREYQPEEFGYPSSEDYLAKYHDTSAQIFLAYGVSDWLALEFETGHIEATFEKDPADPTATPVKITEKGVGDIEGQVRLRLLRETEGRPEIFGYVEITAPSNSDKVLIGDEFWEFRPGVGFARGFSWGTMSIRTTYEYNRDNSHPDLGETSLEYLRRLSPAWRLHLAFEGGETGAPDEWEFQTGLQWRVADAVLLKFDNAVGVTPKATDWSPQAGVMFAFLP